MIPDFRARQMFLLLQQRNSTQKLSAKTQRKNPAQKPSAKTQDSHSLKKTIKKTRTVMFWSKTVIFRERTVALTYCGEFWSRRQNFG